MDKSKVRNIDEYMELSYGRFGINREKYYSRYGISNL